MFDKDNKGYIDAFKLRIILQTLGLETREDLIFRMIANANPENNGVISYQQFKNAIAK